MQKRVRKLLFICLISFILSLPCSFALFDKNIDVVKESDMNLVQNEVTVNDLDIEPLNTQKIKKDIVPDAKKEGKKVILLFLKTMLAVVICALILPVILLFVKKYYGSAFANNENEEFDGRLELNSPNTKEEALRSFLNRSK